MNGATVIPHDLPLPLPAPIPILVAVLLTFFLLHIVFINMMIGGAFLTLWYQVKGLTNRRWDDLAHDIAASITVNKSIAVVLGVGPLLAINTLYTTYFYSANALTGDFWISIIPLVAGAFLLTYLHKYLWGRMPIWLHIGLILLVVTIFSFIPIIFLVNITLMLAPERWTEVQGFWDAASLPNVWTRYAHFILSCPAMIGLMLVWSYRRKTDAEIAKIGIDRAELIKIGYRWAFWPTIAQFIVGPIVWLSLPEVSTPGIAVMVTFGLAIPVTAIPCVLMWQELRATDTEVGRRFGATVATMLAVIILMVVGRHEYRESAVDKHRTEMAKKTEIFIEASKQAREAEEKAQ